MEVLTAQEVSELQHTYPDSIQQNVSLKKISSWKVGGTADLVLEPSSLNELESQLTWFSSKGITPTIIGGTTNLLFDDKGLRNPCIKIGNRFSKICVNGNTISAQSGAWVPKLARLSMINGLTGLEHSCGIPGTIGGLVCMNGGSQRKMISDCIEKIYSISKDGISYTRNPRDCSFGYRKSVFQYNNEVITGVKLRLERADSQIIRKEMLHILSSRRIKFPRKSPNCGSVFKSSPLLYENFGPPGSVIESVGLKGFTVGGATISSHHANFIVNNGNATAADILFLISYIVRSVQSHFKFTLESEVLFLDHLGNLSPACKKATE